MDKKTVTLIAVIAAILLGAFLIVRSTSGGAGTVKPPDRNMMVNHMAGLPVEQLKFTRSKWSSQLEMYRKTAGIKPQVISDAERNLAELDKILKDKGIDPESIAAAPAP